MTATETLAAKDTALQSSIDNCACGGNGYFVVPNSQTGEPEQEQCAICDAARNALPLQPDTAPTHPETDASIKAEFDLQLEIDRAILSLQGYTDVASSPERAAKFLADLKRIVADPAAAIETLVSDRNAWQRECEALREKLQLTEWGLQTAQEAAVDLAAGQSRLIEAIGEEELANRGIQLTAMEGSE